MLFDKTLRLCTLHIIRLQNQAIVYHILYIKRQCDEYCEGNIET